MTRTAKPATKSRVTLHQLMVPSHANAMGNVHGGVLMRMVDEAGAISAMRHAERQCVTIAIDSMTFRQPVHVGELLMCEARVTYVGRTSIEVAISVHAEALAQGTITHTNSAFAVYVALDDNGHPCEAPPLILETDEERQLWAAGAERQARRTGRST